MSSGDHMSKIIMTNCLTQYDNVVVSHDDDDDDGVGNDDDDDGVDIHPCYHGGVV